MYVPFENINAESKLWVYVCNKPISAEQRTFFEDQMKSFVEQWTAHKKDLKASFNLLYDQILLIAVDETQSSASGCSIDTSVHFLKKLQHQLSVDFFNRMLIPFVKSEDQLQLIPMSEIKNALEQNMINNETLTLNPSVSNKIGFETEGWIPLGKSWMANLLQLKTSE